MSESGFTNDDAFEPSSTRESLVMSAAFESVNVCRAAALATLLQGNRAAFLALNEQMQQLGFQRPAAIAAEDWREHNPFQTTGDRRLAPGEDIDEDRIERWLLLNETGRAGDAVAFLVALLASTQERESAAAAAALWRRIYRPALLSRLRGRWWPMYEVLIDDDLLFDRLDPWWSPPLDLDADDQLPQVEWSPGQWREVFDRAARGFGTDRYSDPYLVLALSRLRLGQALRSPDPITRSLALAAFEPRNPPEEPSAAQPSGPAGTTAPGALVVSTIIHGTWGWKGDWWRPAAPFHDYILRNHRPNLYSRGAKFSWSGAYSQRQRLLAVSDFRDWAYDVAPHGLQTLFGHSYGADIAAMVCLSGTRVHECVLLSAPATPVARTLPSSDTRVVDVRLPFDPVLAIAGEGQRLEDPAVVEVILHRWRLNHAATHEPAVWQLEDVARRAKL